MLPESAEVEVSSVAKNLLAKIPCKAHASLKKNNEVPLPLLLYPLSVTEAFCLLHLANAARAAVWPLEF